MTHTQKNELQFLFPRIKVVHINTILYSLGSVNVLVKEFPKKKKRTRTRVLFMFMLHQFQFIGKNLNVFPYITHTKNIKAQIYMYQLSRVKAATQQ